MSGWFRLTAAAAACLVAWWLAGCQDGTGPDDGGAIPCAADADCPAGQRCEQGVCVPTAGCSDDGDCPAGMVCNRVSGECVLAGPGDGDDGDAPDGQDGGPGDAADGADGDPAGPDALACTAGHQRCVDGERIETCVDGQAWELTQVCEAALGESCDNFQIRCLTPCQAGLGAASNTGCVFWPLALSNRGNEGYDAGSGEHRWGAGLRLFVANPGAETASLNLSDHFQSFDLGAVGSIPAGGSVVIDLPQVPAGQVPERHVLDGSQVSYAAFRLESDQPVVAYQFNPANMAVASADASLLLPQRALGKYHQVLTVPHSTKTVGDQTYHHPAGFAVVATRDDTHVSVRVTAPTSPLVVPAYDDQALAEGHDLSALSAGEQRTFVLNRHEVLNLVTAEPAACGQVKDPVGEHQSICIRPDNFITGFSCNVYARWFCQPGADLSGTRVIADAPVAVFAHAAGAMVPYYMFGSEHLEAQLPPIETWGKTFLLGRLAPRYRYYGCTRGNQYTNHESTCPFGSGEAFYRIVAAQDDTRVMIYTPIDPVTIEEAPKDFNYYNQVDWVTAPTDWPAIAGVACVDPDQQGFCVAEHVLDAGEVLSFDDVFNHVIMADKAVLVSRLIPAEEYVGIPYSDAPDAYQQLLMFKGGDPAMDIVVPSDQFRSAYVVNVVGALRYGYLGLVARAGDRIVLDEGTAGEVILDTADGSWDSIGFDYVSRFYEVHNTSNRDRPREVPGATYSDVLEGGGVHTLRGLEGATFGVQIYGFDHYVSYDYPGGLSLEDTNPGYMPGD